MAGARAVKVKYPSVSLKAIAPSIPRNKEEKDQLAKDLTRMGCKGLLVEPWTLRSEAMAQEFLRPRSNQWEKTIRQLPEWWTADSWAEVYSFQKEGRTVAGRTNRWVEGKFKSSIHSKDGHAVDDCVDPREQWILEFVVPIIYPEKPNKVSKVVGNTIFGALSGKLGSNNL